MIFFPFQSHLLLSFLPLSLSVFPSFSTFPFHSCYHPKHFLSLWHYLLSLLLFSSSFASFLFSSLFSFVLLSQSFVHCCGSVSCYHILRFFSCFFFFSIVTDIIALRVKKEKKERKEVGVLSSSASLFLHPSIFF